GRRLLDIPHDQALAELKHIGLNKKVLASARQDCLDLGIKYDNWFYESQLYRDGQYELVLEMLREKDLLFEHDGALWFAASQIDPDAKEEVVIRSTGRPGYFASDIAYHYNKFVERKFEKVIDVWGADHQGHVPRMKAVMQALDLDPDRLVLIVYQLVTIKMGGEDIRLSKRAGTLVRLRELIDQVGSDAIRYILLSRSADSQMEFDIDLVLEQSDRNPVYYVQYAHARMCSILREAERLDLDHSQGDVHDLKVPAEHSLIKKMIQLSWQIEKAARELSPHFLPYYAHELATELNQFYRDCRVLPSERMESDIPLNITFARLKLVSAARIILARTLELMGMSAPERM
ncbi:MAG: arginine--tRNA ligase, partial [Chloroflexota bacterium]